MLVIAAPGLKVPQEEKPRTYIGDDVAVEVPESAYYLRRLADGDLLDAPPADAAASAKPKKGAE